MLYSQVALSSFSVLFSLFVFSELSPAVLLNTHEEIVLLALVLFKRTLQHLVRLSNTCPPNIAVLHFLLVFLGFLLACVVTVLTTLEFTNT